jgi:acyl-CoA synthetase (AMP-forming)/AMP-acid ligase II
LPNARFFNLYGPTEATGMSCYWKADRTLDEGEPIPVGVPFRNTDLLLIKEDGSEAKAGETGEIYLRGTCVTLGYYNNPEKTKEAFVQNPLQKAYPETVYRTGDLGYINPHGELVFVCRRDAQIKHMGHRIELGEIESAAARCEKIARACALYDKEAQKIRLYYTGEIEEGALLGFLKAYLPRYMMPSICKKLDAMPLTPNGKLDRRTLSERKED